MQPNPITVYNPACVHCGEADAGVVANHRYVRGMGTVNASYCQDSGACWRRWDRRHGF